MGVDKNKMNVATQTWRVLITGGTGLVGKAIERHVQESEGAGSSEGHASASSI